MSTPRERRPRAAGKIRTFLRLDPPLRRAVLRTALLATAVEIGLRTLRLPTLARLLGLRLGTEPAPRPSGDERPIESLERDDLRAVRATALVFRNWPFGAGPCLRRSLVLGRLLADHAPVLRIGVAREDGALRAHAWVEVEGCAQQLDPRQVDYKLLGNPGGAA